MAQTETLRPGKLFLLAACCSLAGNAAWAAKPKDKNAFLDHKEFFRPELSLTSSQAPLDALEASLPNAAAWGQFRANSAQELAPGQGFRAFIDPRSGAATNVMGAFPLIPGGGVGNQVTLGSLQQSLGIEAATVTREVVAQAVRQWVVAHRHILNIDVAQLGDVHAEAVRDDLWHFTIPQVYQGIRVRDARVAGTIVKGNLVLVGAETWGDVKLLGPHRLTAEQALEKGFAHAEGRIAQDELVREPALEIVPIAPPEFQQANGFQGPVGKGYRHRLVWTFVFQRPPDDAAWEIMVDAHSGEVLAFQDKNLYAERAVTGGVYPLTDTGICPNAQQCGTMQSGWPMPFADTGFAAPNDFTNSAGLYDYSSGLATTTLTGKYVDMVDTCGAISESNASGAINLGGSNNQHDCTSGGASAGNTAASRSGFYELNKLIEQARGWLPTNQWLQGRLTSNMNLNSTCNAFYSFSGTINFYKSGGSTTVCRNTGELAAVFDHEWGHAMDDNDSAGALSNSSEAYADIAAIYRLNASCVGHGFFQSPDRGCGTTADGTGVNQNEAQQGAAHCDTDCSGVRDADYLKHNPNTPDTALGFVCNSCLASSGPCGRQVHCAAAPVRQMAWDLVKRDLTSAPFNYDNQTALMVGTKLFYQGSGNVGLWHACTCGSTSDGCGATHGYMQWLAADDDNGNINDGTPHMTAIYNAYNRHGIACSTPTPVNSGCSGQPNGTAGPSLSASGGNFSASLSWSPVSAASTYWVMRTEGHAGAEFGKSKIAEVTGTSYTDTEVANGRNYWYNVVAQGTSPSCYSRVSNAVQVTPTAAPDFSLSCSPSSLSVQQGNSGTSTCTVGSSGGFASAVTLDCASLPAGVSCSYSPNPVTPPSGGSANSGLTVTVASSVPIGSYTFQARGTSGSLVRTANMSLSVTAVPQPDFSVSANPTSVTVLRGGSGTSTIGVASINGFSSAVSLSASGLPSGVTATFSVNPVTPPGGGSASSTLTFSASSTATTGTVNVTVAGTSGALTRTRIITLTINSVTVPGQAVFDTVLQAPKCSATRSVCDTGTTLVKGRDTMSGGAESNQPNTIADSCADGTSGTYLNDESIERLRIVSVSGGTLTAGGAARIEATVHVWPGGPASDHLDLYYAANANSPVWTPVATNITPTSTQGGIQTFTATYTLPAGGLQAIRANFRYGGAVSSCSTGAYDDRDDLVFAVAAPQQILVNPGFESGSTGWTASAGVIDGSSTPAHSGVWKAWLDGYGTTHTDTVYQRVTIPSNATTATLSFWLWISSEETTTSVAYDTLKVQILNSAGGVVATLATYSNLHENGGYALKSYNVSAYRGQTIYVYLRGDEDISLATSFLVDDFALNVIP